MTFEDAMGRRFETKRYLTALSSVRKIPETKDRALKAAILLEQVLRSLPVPARAPTRVPLDQASLGNLIAAHFPKFSRGRALKGLVWVRDDLAHGLEKSVEADWKYAVHEFERGIEELVGGVEHSIPVSLPHSSAGCPYCSFEIVLHRDHEPLMSPRERWDCPNCGSPAFLLPDGSIYAIAPLNLSLLPSAECPACLEPIRFDRAAAHEGYKFRCEHCNSEITFAEEALFDEEGYWVNC